MENHLDNNENHVDCDKLENKIPGLLKSKMLIFKF